MSDPHVGSVGLIKTYLQGSEAKIAIYSALMALVVPAMCITKAIAAFDAIEG